MQTVDYSNVGTADDEIGRRKVAISIVLSLVSAILSTIAALYRYHSYAFTREDLIAAVGTCASILVASLGIFYGISARRRLDGRVGVVAILIPSLALAGSICGAIAVPSYGLGNIH